jgi:chain length determinant protein (polysaccharide antigen chain regulator)
LALSKSNIADEIDFLHLINAVWQGRNTILVTTALSMLMMAAYIILGEKNYEVKLYASAPSSANVAHLNIGLENIGNFSEKISSDDVFKLFKQNIRSRSLAKEFYQTHFPSTSASHSEDYMEEFYKRVRLDLISKKNPYLVVSLINEQPEEIAGYLNDYIKFVRENTKRQLIESATLNKKMAYDQMAEKINSHRELYRTQLSDGILRLKEASVLAKKLGITTVENNGAINIVLERKQKLGGQDAMLYLRGSKVLDAQIQLLKERNNVDPYVSAIRPIQEKMGLLRSIKYRESLLEVVRVDEWAVTPLKPISPKAILLLPLSSILGGLLGLMIVFFKVSSKAARTQ